MIGLRRGVGGAVVDPNLKLELKFNVTNYTDLAATVAANTNDYVRAWKSSVGGHVFSQSTDAARPQRQPTGMYFDGGDWVTMAGSSFDFGTGDFTVAAWVNVATLAHDNSIFCRITTWASSMAYYLRVTSLGAVDFYGGNSTAIAISSASSLILANTWAHVAAIRSNGVTKIYINGLQSGGTHTGSVSISNSAPLDIGTFSRTSHFFEGKMTDIVIYDKALYTANFTPPARSS